MSATLAKFLQIENPHAYRVAQHFEGIKWHKGNADKVGHLSKPFQTWFPKGAVTNLLVFLRHQDEGLFCRNLKILGYKDTGQPSSTRYQYQFEEVEDFCRYFYRLYINLPYRAQFLRTETVQVSRVLDEPFQIEFPGLLNVEIRLSDVDQIKAWREYLQQKQVIYLLGKKDSVGRWIFGKRYIGSATREQGAAFGRLMDYVKGNHGNNFGEIDDPDTWFWKIVYVADPDETREQIIRREHRLINDYCTLHPYGLNRVSDEIDITIASKLRLTALATDFDRLWVPQLDQVLILAKGLSHICGLGEPHNLPDQKFNVEPCCPEFDSEDLEEGIASEGIDFFGQYDPNEIKVTVNMCRMRRFATRHGFQFEEIIKIVLIHELAHFVTHRGKAIPHNFNSALTPSDLYEVAGGQIWLSFARADDNVREDFAQKATNLYLRMACYGNLVQVFDSLANHSPQKYNSWRDEWKKQSKNPDNSFSTAKNNFRCELYCKSERSGAVKIEEMHVMTGYDEEIHHRQTYAQIDIRR